MNKSSIIIILINEITPAMENFLSLFSDMLADSNLSASSSNSSVSPSSPLFQENKNVSFVS